jgi:HEAT repeat protein
MADDPQKPAPPPPPPPKPAAAPPPPPAAQGPADTPGTAEGPPAPPAPAAPAEATPPQPSAARPDDPPPQAPAPGAEVRAAAPPAEPVDPQPASIPSHPPAPTPLESPLTDDEERQTLKKIGRHTTPFGRIATVLIVLGGIATAGLYYWQSTASDQRRARLDAIAEIEDDQQRLTELRTLLSEAREKNLKWRIIKNLGHFQDAQAVPDLIEQLDDAGRVRRAAAWSLARIGSPAADAAKPKLLEVLPKTDEKDRAQVVWTLAVLGATEAGDAIVEEFTKGLIQNLEGFDPKVIADVLGPDRLASDDLLNHPEESVRVLTAHALAEANKASAIEPLSRLLTAETGRDPEKQSSEVVRAAASGLGRIGDPKAARPLFTALQGSPKNRQDILDAIGRSTGAKDLSVLVREAQHPDIKRDLVRLLAATRDPASADTLASILDSDDEDIRHEAAFALAELHDERAAPVLLELAREEDESIQDKAIGRLRLVASPAITSDLAELLKDTPHRKADLLRALGKTGDPAAARHAEAELDGDDAPAAAMALADLDHEPGYRKLVKKVARPKDVDMAASNPGERSVTNEDILRVRKAAIVAMGLFGKEEVADDLMKIVEDSQDDYELRAMSAEALGQIGTLEVIKKVVRKMGDASLDADIRRYYVQALWQRPIPELSSELLGLMMNAEAPVSVRRAAALAVGYIGSPDNDDRLMEALDDPEGVRYAAIAITLGGSPKGAHKLLDVLAKDADVREILQMHLMNDEGGWFSVLTKDMFESGQIWRRLTVSEILKEGHAKTSFSYAWAKTVTVLRTGWEGPNGVTAKGSRERLYEALTGGNDEQRRLAARTLMDMGEAGILLRARDAGGPGADAVRHVMRLEAKK